MQRYHLLYREIGIRAVLTLAVGRPPRPEDRPRGWKKKQRQLDHGVDVFHVQFHGEQVEHDVMVNR